MSRPDLSPSDPSPRSEEFDPRRPIAAELELGVSDGFSLTAAGDCIISRPMSHYRDSEPRFAALLDVLKASSVAYANLETVLLDTRSVSAAPYAWNDDGPLRGEPSAASDLKVMGFDVFSRANNHALDWGLEGMRETSRHLDANGLAHAGCGETLALARQACFHETPHGRVGLVSCVTTYRNTTNALDQHGSAPGRPGLNGLPLKRSLSVPASMHDRIEAIRSELAAAEIHDALGGFERGDAPQPEYRYELDDTHMAEILRQIRQGKQFADFMLVALHAHEGRTTSDPTATAAWIPELPGAFVSEFGRRAIGAGADAVLTTGLHHVGPIEIYAGRPILTGLGNFFWSDIQTPIPSDIYQLNAPRMKNAFAHPERATDADLTLMVDHPFFAHEETFLGVLAEMRFDATGLTKLTLHPVDLGYGERLVLSGLPRLAGPEPARALWKRLQAISAPCGTELVTVEDPARDTIVAEVVL
jgi:poly-gamma-glutamate capsule biosynthesis protein CapA/YwtB (metallophosphatase superfamily)